MIFTRPAGAVMIFTRSRNAATHGMYCMIPDAFPSSVFGKGSATPDYNSSCIHLQTCIIELAEISQCSAGGVVRVNRSSNFNPS